MASEPYAYIHQFTQKYGTVRLEQDDVGVTGEAVAPGVLIYETVWKGGPYASLPEAMNSLDQELEKWLQNKW
ncbi:MAG: hypothetical protein AB8G95_16890 [Anaerolineae bacterium]